MNKCRTCKDGGSVSSKTLKNYRYTESGYPNVYLTELKAYFCAVCDEQSISFRAIGKLHDAMEKALAGDEERECTFTLKQKAGEWFWDMLLPDEVENIRIMEMAWNYGYHRKDCVIMAEMAGPTPITSKCSCGWQAFADELKEKLGK
jgi:hypothetical protein